MKPRVLSPREAERLARSLGWRVEQRRGTGELLYIAPDGTRFVSTAPGRKHHVCRKLAVMLQRQELAARQRATDPPESR